MGEQLRLNMFSSDFTFGWLLLIEVCSMIPDIDELSISHNYPEDSLVASSSVLHEVKHPNLVGRVNWEWERNQG